MNLALIFDVIYKSLKIYKSLVLVKIFFNSFQIYFIFSIPLEKVIPNGTGVWNELISALDRASTSYFLSNNELFSLSKKNTLDGSLRFSLLMKYILYSWNLHFSKFWIVLYSLAVEICLVLNPLLVRRSVLHSSLGKFCLPIKTRPS